MNDGTDSDAAAAAGGAGEGGGPGEGGGSGEAADAAGSAESPPAKRRGLIRRHPVLSGLLVLVLVVLLGAGAWLWYLDSRLGEIQKFEAELDRPGRPERVATESLNILLAGVDDGRGVELESALAATEWPAGIFRTDTMMVLHLNADREQAQLISIPRDSYVPVPGHGTTKINAAFSYGGPGLLARTVEDFTGLYLDHIAVVDLAGFRAITDAVGGVDLPVDGTVRHMDGAEALEYVRERKSLPRGDFSRIERQQAFFKAVMRQGLEEIGLDSPIALTELLEATTSHLALDHGFSNGDVRALAWESRGLRPDDIRFLTIPHQGTDTVDGASIVRVDQAEVRELFAAVAEDRFERWAKAHPADEPPK